MGWEPARPRVGGAEGVVAGVGGSPVTGHRLAAMAKIGVGRGKMR
ncbi:hypothetical protein TIFTF001_009013 [Ficus carica]|uniref:Uncharacterized protein n=1 Tax=Ficus carica TaxID=3494 RepID=A0AA87ZP37_FICCA|nr:hypothetical protein TIFTF001_009013 [Ficus carica]